MPLVQSHPPQLLLWEHRVNLAVLRGGLHGMTHVELQAHALRELACMTPAIITVVVVNIT